MFNHNKVPWWRRLIGLSAVCMVCNLIAIMPSHASMCLVYDADNPDCVDSQNYASVLSSFCDSEDAIDINSKEYKDLIDSSYKCTELQDCPGKATCTPPDCQSLNFNDYGKDFEFSDKYTSGKGNNRTINPEAAAKYNDWPAGKVVDGHNDTEHWACYICEFVGKNGKVVRPKQKNVEGVNVHSWQCARVDICAEGDTAYPRDGQSFDDFVKDQQEKCAENNEGNQLWKFIVGKSNDSSYYCGHCEVETIAGCSSGVPETNMPIGVTCYDKCGEGNSKFTGERTTLADGTKDVRCCIFGEMNTKCSCDADAVAQYDPEKPTNAECSGHAWNNGVANVDPAQPACSCIIKPCEDGSATIDANNPPQGPNAQGYYTVKKNGKCYAKKFNNWHGDDACYKDVEMTEENGFGCEEGMVFDEELCECIAPACPEGWTIYAQTSSIIGKESTTKDVEYKLVENTSRFLFGSTPNMTFTPEALEKMAVEDAADNCGKSGRKGWAVVYKDDAGRTHRAAAKIGNEYVKGADGKYQVYQCGYCAPKKCPKDNEDQSKNTATLSHCGGNKMITTATEFYQGDEQCYTCPYCWDNESIRNSCYQEIIDKNLVTCWSPDGSIYGENTKRWGDKLVPICSCAGTDYYENCYVLKPTDGCSYFTEPEMEHCTKALTDYVVGNHGIPGRTYKLESKAGSMDTEMKRFNVSYENPYAISRCQYPYGRGLDNDGKIVVQIAECTAEKTCTGHGPAWNPEANGGKGAAMVTCDANNHEYGVMGDGRSPVECSGKIWYDSCEVSVCTPNPDGDDGIKCADGSTRDIGEILVSNHQSTQWSLYSSSGNGQYYSVQLCSYDELGIEKWYIEDCDAQTTCDGSEAPGWDSKAGKPRKRFENGKGMLCQGTKYVCGNDQDDRYNVVFYDSEYNGEENCQYVTDMKGSNGENFAWCNLGYCEGETMRDTDGNNFCAGNCVTVQCSDSEYCTGEVKDGYCLGECEKFPCAKVTSNSEEGCNTGLHSDTNTTFGWGTNLSDGTYIVKMVCPTSGELQAGDRAKYAVAVCTTAKDCSGKPGPAYGKVETCGAGMHPKEGAIATNCGGIDYYDPNDCENDPYEEAPAVYCETNPGNGISVIGGDGMVDTGVSCQSTNGDTYNYYIPCDQESTTFVVGGSSYTKNGPYQGYYPCGNVSDNPETHPDALTGTCGNILYAKMADGSNGCAEKCNDNWTKELCESTTYAGATGVFNLKCGTIYGSCTFDGIEVGKSDKYTEVLDEQWCLPTDPHYEVNRCGAFYNK
ncbi:MAG: hypothetical protein IJ218_02960 [Alphaproteobacteria bacterium]|nr:hypothetical protein [Alphaproteobacteria bacterium]